MPYETTSDHILLIDDNNLDVDLFEQAIRKTTSSVQLDVARDGEQALAYLKRWEFDAPLPRVILLDLKLPKVDGLEVLRALKSHPRFKVIPVVMLTSSNQDADIQQAYKLGANSYLMKSVDYDEFAEAVALIRHYWCELNIYPG